jgi:lipopolysaccharide export system permease protein
MLFHSSIRKELARSFGATLIVLVTVVMTMTLIRTLGLASRGSFNPSDVILVMGYNVLAFLPNIMTMSLFIAMVSTLSRWYRDSEMVIWFSSGVGLFSLLRPMFRFAWPILLAVAGLALFVLPWSNQQIQDMKGTYENRGDLERVQPGQFQESAGGKRVFFVEKSLQGQQSANNVFIASTENGKETVTSARQGQIKTINEDKFLVLDNGQRLENTLGKSDLKVSEFEVYGLLVEPGQLGDAQEIPLNTRPLMYLLQHPSALHWGEISWRIGFVLACINLIVIALAASRVNPRVGRSGNLIFSLLLFQVYLNLLNLGQAWIQGGQISFLGFIVGVHGSIFAASLLWLAKRHYNWHWLALPSVLRPVNKKPVA